MTQKTQGSLKSWQVILLLGVVLTSAVLGILQWLTKDDLENAPPAILTEMTCGDSGGTWNACGSACRENPEAPCIEVCVNYCECTADDQCPFGFSCGAMVDGTGVCEAQ